MEKKFRLPKEFAEKWLIALRSGQYLQGQAFLAYQNLDENETCSYCCLGVAGIVCGMDLNQLLDREVYDWSQDLVPVEIQGEAIVISLVKVLTTLNDGCSLITVEQNFKDYIFRDLNQLYEGIVRGDIKNFTFLEIADFIEDNCEFY